MIDLTLFVHCAVRLIVSQPVHNFFSLFVERIDFFHSLLRCYQLFHRVALKPQFIAFVQLEQLSKEALNASLIIENCTSLETIEKLQFVFFETVIGLLG